jgi:hypothetical protein
LFGRDLQLGFQGHLAFGVALLLLGRVFKARAVRGVAFAG